MREVRKMGFALCIVMALLVLTGFGAKHYTTSPNGSTGEAIARRIALLRSGKPQQKAAAAYLLGQPRAASTGTVASLADLLGGATDEDATPSRPLPLDQMTLGVAGAAALSNIVSSITRT